MAKQRAFPWISEAPKPSDAPMQYVVRCEEAKDAIALSLRVSKVTAKRVADYMGVSEATISQIKRGARPVLDWMVEPFCYATGTNLLQQFFDYRNAQLIVRARKSERERIEAIAYEMLRAA